MASRIIFQTIKQLIHINSFIGKSENLVITQIWTALITILMLKAQSKFGSHLSNLLVFEKIEIQKWLYNPFLECVKPPPKSILGVLFLIGQFSTLKATNKRKILPNHKRLGKCL